MKHLKIFFIASAAAILLTSCYAEVLVDDVEEVAVVEVVEVVEVAPPSLAQMLNSHELWYVDINATLGFGEIPFLQKAFTISFLEGTLYANNNLVGIGSLGNGFGIDVASYNTFGTTLDVKHDIDGLTRLEVFQIDGNTLELYHRASDTSYFLEGYQRRGFDYDTVFYDNIHYFLQEYEAWEKVYTSRIGALNEFDNEHYLQFLSGNNDATFRSSQDPNGIAIPNILWDYTGIYNVADVVDTPDLKILTLDYDFFNGEFFELSIINDQRIRLFHPASETIYEFEGQINIQFLKAEATKKSTAKTEDKKRKFRKLRKDNPRA